MTIEEVWESFRTAMLERGVADEIITTGMKDLFMIAAATTVMEMFKLIDSHDADGVIKFEYDAERVMKEIATRRKLHG